MPARLYPPSELQAADDTIRSLSSNIVAYHFGEPHEVPWLFDRAGAAFPILITARSLEFMFEVFSLDVPNEQEVRDRHAGWTPRALPDDFPEELRIAASTRPPLSVPPEAREPWPYERWRLDVLKRVEFIVEDVEALGAVGQSPNLQGAARPNEVPTDAAAACEAAVAMLFSGVDGGRLLIGVDWMPTWMVITRDPAEIDGYLEACTAVPVGEYQTLSSEGGYPP